MMYLMFEDDYYRDDGPLTFTEKLGCLAILISCAAIDVGIVYLIAKVVW